MAQLMTAKPAKASAKKETFTIVAPKAASVQLAGNFTNWEKNPIAMKKLKDGTWKTTVPLKPGSYEYRYLVDGQWRNDDSCSARKPNAFGEENCVRQVN